MRIERLECWPVEMALAEPYTIAYESVERTTNIFVRLTAGRHEGVGCAAPDPAITGETAEEAREALDRVVEPRVVGSDPRRRAGTIELLRGELRGRPAALAAIDIALHDLLGKILDVPLWQLLGGFRDRIATSVTIGILPDDETVRAALELTDRGFRCLKLKGGLDAEADAERVRAVRAAVGSEVEIRFDANQGYTLEQTREFVRATADASLELLEQPTPRGDQSLLGRVTNEVDLPVMADESLVTLRDAFRLAGRELVDLVNVKLMRVGGLSEALHIDSVARSARIASMVGCGDESEVAIAAGLAFALARPNVRYADLDGSFDLVGDPAAGSLVLRYGELYAPEGPGLGVTLGAES